MKHTVLLIIALDNGQAPLSHHLGNGDYLLGRSGDCHIPVPSADVSLQHARLIIRQNEIRLEDLGSTNGTFLAGKRLEGPAILRPPQQIRLGNTWIEIRSSAPGYYEDAIGPVSSAVEYVAVKKYHLGRLVDRGGMGEVIEALDNRLGRVVALKRVPGGKNLSSERRCRFEREAQILSQLEHPNIVPIHDLDLDDQGQPFYTMKLVKGTTLHQVIEGIKSGQPEVISQYPLSSLLTVFQKICDAVSFAHSKGVVHRDLKPANIMLGGFGEVLVLDWGLAKLISQPPDTTSEENRKDPIGDPQVALPAATLEGQILGTPSFMSPEQAEGRVDAIDVRTDVFALGGILYNILTLRPPVSGATAQDAIEKIKSGHILPPTTYNRTVRSSPPPQGVPEEKVVFLSHCPGAKIPEALSAVAMKALAFAPEDRYPSVADLQKDIMAFQGGFATSAEQAGAWRLMCLARKRRQTEFSLAAVALVILVLVGIFSFWRISTTLAELRKSAPAHHEKAQALVQAGKFEEALERANYAVTLAPDQAEYRFLKACLLQTLLRLPEARNEFARILHQDRNPGRARQNMELCDRLLGLSHGAPKLSATAIEQLHQALQEQGRTSEALEVLSLLGDNQQRQFNRWQERLQQAGISRKLERHEDGAITLDLHELTTSDLTPLRGIPLTALSLHGCTNVSDLAPLTGMKLRHLDLWDCNVTDLAPLQGMALEVVHFGNGPVTNLAPLRGMPLVEISFYNTRVADLSPLRGMQLRSFGLVFDDQLTDISPLRGMPITWLRLGNCRQLTNVSALAGMKLEFLELGGPIGQINMLHGMPIHHLALGNIRVDDLNFMEGMPLRDLYIMDALALRDIGGLKELPLTNIIIQTAPQLKNISVLQGFPLDYLQLHHTAVSDLSPLKGMPLRSLYLTQSPIRDLSPLSALTNLEFLQISDCQAVQDISPLRGLRLRSLLLHGCIQLRNVAPLAECRNLEKLILPPYARDLSALRKELTQLKLISYAYSDYEINPIPPDKAPAAFWRKLENAPGR
jgi:serine/threonine protein kinase/Leucine-rich repeat (LRR) protein